MRGVGNYIEYKFRNAFCIDFKTVKFKSLFASHNDH